MSEDNGVGCRDLLAVLTGWKQRVAELERNNDFRAHCRDEFSMDHGERNGIDSCIDDIQALLSSANNTYPTPHPIPNPVNNESTKDNNL